MRKLINMQNIHAGKPAIILGGGTSLLNDVAQIPTQAMAADYQLINVDRVLFAVNDHAFHVGYEPHYMVFMDDPVIKPELYKLAKQSERQYQRVTDLLQYTDIDLRGVPRPDSRSGIFATWLAMYFGCAPVFLCGMDLYTLPEKYIHEHDNFMGRKPIFNEPLERHIEAWSKLKRYKGSRRIKAVSGPLTQVFGSMNVSS